MEIKIRFGTHFIFSIHQVKMLQKYSPEFYDFHFYCLDPFLSSTDWLALSRCCKFFHKQCDTKNTLYPKIRSHISSMLNKESPFFAEIIFQLLREYNGVISGSFVLSMLTGEKNFNDIDIFYESKIPMPLPKTFVLDDTLDTRYYNSSVSHIKTIQNYHSLKTNQKIQCIQLKKEENKLEEKKQENKGEEKKDHYIRQTIFQQFDLDFCKIVFTPEYLEVYDSTQIINRSSKMYLSKDFLNLCFNYESSNPRDLKKQMDRIDKYKTRGFHIENESDIYDLNRIHAVCQISYKHYDKLVTNETKILNLLDEKTRLEAEEKKMEKEYNEKKKRLEKRIILHKQKEKTYQTLITQYQQIQAQEIYEELITNPTNIINSFLPNTNWFTCEPFSNEGRMDHVKPNQHELYEVFQGLQLSPKIIYHILCYTNADLLKIFFDKQHIPYAWVKPLVPHVEAYYAGTLPHRVLNSKNPKCAAQWQDYFWRYIYSHFPYHHELE